MPRNSGFRAQAADVLHTLKFACYCSPNCGHIYFVPARLAQHAGKRTGELSLARELWQHVPPQSLVIVDKGLLEYGAMYRLNHDDNAEVAGQTHWLAPAKSNASWNRVKRLANGDAIVKLKINSKARKEDPNLPPTMRVRAIIHDVPGFRSQIFLTSMLDAAVYPAREIRGLP